MQLIYEILRCFNRLYLDLILVGPLFPWLIAVRMGKIRNHAVRNPRAHSQSDPRASSQSGGAIPEGNPQTKWVRAPSLYFLLSTEFSLFGEVQLPSRVRAL